MRQGWVLIFLGLLGAAVFRHPDAVVMGAFMLVLGAWIITVKGARQ